MKKKCLGMIMSFAIALTLIAAPVTVSAQEPVQKADQITVKIGDAEPQPYDSWDAAIGAARTADDAAAKVITLPEGNFTPVNGESFRINEPNTTIIGAGVGLTTIDTGATLVSGQAGILVQADNVTIQDLSVVSEHAAASAGTIKVSMIGDGTSLPNVNNVTISNVDVNANGAGFALNLHGVKNATVTDVTAVSTTKAAVNLANATEVNFTRLEAKGTGVDVWFSYKANSAAYNTPSQVTFTDSTFANNMIMTERPAADGGADSVTVSNDNLVMVEGDNGAWVICDKNSDVVTGAVYNETQGTYYAQTALQSALNEANAGDVIKLKNGTYEGPFIVNTEVTVIGESKEGTVITKASASVDDVIHASAGFTLENATVKGVVADGLHDYTGARIAGIEAEADLTLNNVSIQDIRCGGDGADMCGMQDGFGVWVTGNGNVTISNTDISGFQKTAIVSKTTGKVTITDSVVTGAGPQAVIAQNGIQIDNSSLATVTNNTIKDLEYTADNEWSHCSAGVYIQNVTNAVLADNTVSGVDNYYLYTLETGDVLTVIEGNRTTVITGDDTENDQTEVIVNPMGISIDKEKMELEVGKTGEIIVKVTPADTTLPVEVSTSDAKIATVSVEKDTAAAKAVNNEALTKTVKVKAVKEGTAAITVKVGSLEKQCVVNVVKAAAGNDSATPKTGDTTQVGAYGVIALLSALALVSVVVIKRRRAK